MARAALRLGVRALAAAAKVAVNTITRLEKGDRIHHRNAEAIQHALERGGVEFIAEDESSAGGGAGVRLAKPKRKRAR